VLCWVRVIGGFRTQISGHAVRPHAQRPTPGYRQDRRGRWIRAQADGRAGRLRKAAPSTSPSQAGPPRADFYDLRCLVRREPPLVRLPQSGLGAGGSTKRILILVLTVSLGGCAPLLPQLRWVGGDVYPAPFADCLAAANGSAGASVVLSGEPFASSPRLSRTTTERADRTKIGRSHEEETRHPSAPCRNPSPSELPLLP
jgi:hypothetical protein